MTNITSFKKIKNSYVSLSQKVGACIHAPTKGQGQAMLFIFGVVLLSTGLGMNLEAQRNGTIIYNDQRIVESVNGVLTYLEGSFGALVMVASGIGAILSAAFGQYRAALGLMVVAIGAFILRSLMSTFFNDDNIQP